MSSIEFEEWPGKATDDTVELSKGASATLPLKTNPSDAKVMWANPSGDISPSPEGDYRPDQGQSLLIQSVADTDAGAWTISAKPKEGAGAEASKTFTVKVTAADEGPAPTPVAGPGEWDAKAAKYIYIAAIVTAAVFALIIGLGLIVLPKWKAWNPAKVPAGLVLVLTAAGALALVGAAATAALEVRGRMRKPTEAAAVRGFALPSADQMKAVADVLKGWGSLREPALLGATALALFGGATALAWHLSNTSASGTSATTTTAAASATSSGTLKIAVDDQACTLTALDKAGKKLPTPPAGQYTLAVAQSKTQGFTLKGPNVNISSAAGQSPPANKTVDLNGTYTLTCSPSGKSATLAAK
jgi:hypothetical protein